MSEPIRFVDIIEKKKQGSRLTESEIRYWIRGVTDKSIPDYQTAALLMAIRFQKLANDEIVLLTQSMQDSGITLDLSSLDGPTADKHSTGGVGDKLSFLVGPLAAACGVPVPMLSGRGLGHTGGTLDKLESIPGYRTDLSSERFLAIVREVGISIIGQTGELAPADKTLYALRDVTATVDSIPLIVSSILSKKLAAGPDALVFDVKTGDGAFLPDREAGRELAKRLVEVSAKAGKRSAALITDMNVPLGAMVGNALEIAESARVLRGEPGGDMLDASFGLAEQTLLLTDRAKDAADAARQVRDALDSGRALEVFGRMIEAHGGDPAVLEDESKLPQARCRRVVKATKAGTVTKLPARAIGLLSMRLGAGRETVDDRVDPGAGIELRKKPGDAVSKGEDLAVLYAENEDRLDRGERDILSIYTIEDKSFKRGPSVLETVLSETGTE